MQKFTRPLTREIELAGEHAADLGRERRFGAAGRLASDALDDVLAGLLCQLTTPGRERPGPLRRAGRLGPQTLEDGSAHGGQGGAAQAGRHATGRTSPATRPRQRAGPTSPHCWPARALVGTAPAPLRTRPRPGAGPADSKALQTGLSVPPPDELLQLLTWHNGQSDDFVGALEQSWNLMSTRQILDAKQQLDAGAAAEGPASAWRPSWIPFFDDDAGDYLCLDTSQQPAPVREVWRGKAEAPVAAPSLTAWLESFVSAVEHGDYHEDPECGTFLRKSGSGPQRAP